MMLKPENCLYYPAVASFCEKVMSLAGNNVPLIMNCEIFNSLDYTSIKVSNNIRQIKSMNDLFLLILLFELYVIFYDRVLKRYRKNWTAREINSGYCILIPMSWKVLTFSLITNIFVWSKKKRASQMFFTVCIIIIRIYEIYCLILR